MLIDKLYGAKKVERTFCRLLITFYLFQILINKEDLGEKIQQIKYLENLVKSLETDHAYQIKEMETEHSDKVQELHNGYCAAIQNLKDKNQVIQSLSRHNVVRIPWQTGLLVVSKRTGFLEQTNHGHTIKKLIFQFATNRGRLLGF